MHKLLSQPVVFTAGDFLEGLELLTMVYRRAVLFGLEQRLTADEVVGLTHSQVYCRTLTPFAESVVAQTPRHIRLQYVFWSQLQDGLISPLFDFEEKVTSAFAGMSWSDLRSLYSSMVWVDHDQDASEFLAAARKQGLLVS